MGEVVETSAIPLIESPDDAVVWGVALGLQDEVEERARADRGGRPAGRRAVRLHARLVRGRRLGTAAAADPAAGRPGVMSSSPIPNFGGMMAALGTIGNSPSSSGRRWRRVRSGGGSGGGGGGAGGGF